MTRHGDVEAVADALLEASKALVGIALRTLPEKVTLSQFRALLFVGGAGSMRSADLADRLAVSPSTATRVCDRLVRAGYLRRQPAAADRREVRLSLTSAGAQLVERGLKKRRQALTDLVARIPAADRSSLLRSLAVFEGAALTDKEPAWALGWPGDRTSGAASSA